VFCVREGLVVRVVLSVESGRVPVLLGGPGTGRSTAAAEARRRLAEAGVGVAMERVEGDAPLPAAEPGKLILTGGPALHRRLADLDESPQRLARFPLVPLLRRDFQAWARAEGARLERPELDCVVAACGGHSALFRLWLRERRTGEPFERVEERVAAAAAPLFAQIDAELAEDPELERVYARLDREGPQPATLLRRELRLSKAALDRLVLLGPVSRTLGSEATVKITCGLYRAHRHALS
jgi:hypothetical protein